MPVPASIFEIKYQDRLLQVGEVLPLLPLRDVVVFPTMIHPLLVGRPGSIAAVEDAMLADRLILVATQKDKEMDEPTPADIHRTGTVAHITQLLRLPDGTMKILVEGLARARVRHFVQEEGYFKVQVAPRRESVPADAELDALVRMTREFFGDYVRHHKRIAEAVHESITGIEEPVLLADTVATHIPDKLELKQTLLEEEDVAARLRILVRVLSEEVEILKLERKIESEVKSQVQRNQREFYLNEQLKAIRRELGQDGDDGRELDELAVAIEEAGMPEDVEETALRELDRLAKMPAMSPEASVIRTYIETLAALPWKKRTRDRLDIGRVRKKLDERPLRPRKGEGAHRRVHVGDEAHPPQEDQEPHPLLRRPARRGQDQPRPFDRATPSAASSTVSAWAACATRPRSAATGAPTSARCPGASCRPSRRRARATPSSCSTRWTSWAWTSAAIRRRPCSRCSTPSRTTPSATTISRWTSTCPRCSSSPRPTPCTAFRTPCATAWRSSACRATCSTRSRASPAASCCPSSCASTASRTGQLSIPDATLERIIDEYTRESGVRNLERELATLCRKAAVQIVEKGRKRLKVEPGDLETNLGPPRWLPKALDKVNEVGIATGLAWTQVGGETLNIEVQLVPGKGEFILTGQLGDVMKESAKAAQTIVRSRAESWGIAKDFFTGIDVHIHVPEGATPKDGPSAGVALTTALVSAITGIPVHKDVAMTGEITLRGNILPVGGLPEKTVAAQRLGIRKVLLPKANEKDLPELPESVRKGLELVFVEHIDELLAHALVESPGGMPRGKAGKSGKPKPTPARRRSGATAHA